MPIFVELRRLNTKTTILGLIVEELQSLKGSISESRVRELIVAGGYTFFFDGFDEIAHEHRDDASKAQ